MNDFLGGLAFETSAEAAARICTRLNIAISPDSILRYLRSTSIAPSREVRVLGVDDLAFKKNFSYGTILLDLESRRVIDLLPERTADGLASWLAVLWKLWQDQKPYDESYHLRQRALRSQPQVA